MTHTATRMAQAHSTKGGDLKRSSLHRAIWCLAPAMMLELGVMNVAAALLTLLAPPLITLFDRTPQVVGIGAECLRLVAWSGVASAIGVVLARSFGGAGNTVSPMVANLLSLWGLEVSVAFGLSCGLGWGVTGIW